MLGPFLLGAFSRVDGRAALAGIMAGVAAIFWLTFSPGWTALPVWARSSFHPLLALVIGRGVVLVVGLTVARIRAANGTRCTKRGVDHETSCRSRTAFDRKRHGSGR
jgi:hypothetical protein